MPSAGRWGVILDAGSSGTRLHIYRWKDPARALKDAKNAQDLHSLPGLQTKTRWTKKIRPGVSTFGEKPHEVGPDHLRALVDHALDIIPEDSVKDTPIFLMATAGMRLLPQIQQAALTREICTYFRQHSQFSLPDCGLHIQVIPGETEGLYGWIATNYLLGGFDQPELHNHGKGHHTYGFLDMGGASAQLAFEPNSTEAETHWNDLRLLRLRTIDGSPLEHRVFTTTWLGFGVNQAREAFKEHLKGIYSVSESNEIPDPCMPKGLRTTQAGIPVHEADLEDLTLVGTGAFDECVKLTYPLLGKDKPCVDLPCLLNGKHVPAIDFDVNHFVGVSEYWHMTHGVFGGKGDKVYDWATFQARVRDYCSQEWTAIEAKFDGRHNEAKNAQQACFKASWMINVLHDGIGIPRLGLEKTPVTGLNVTKEGLEGLERAKENGLLDPFHAVQDIDGIEVSWTLGKMVLYAAGQIPPKTGDDSFPVGFGSNTIDASQPHDFQLAGSTWRPSPGHQNSTLDSDAWSDKAEDLLDQAKENSTSSVLIIMLLFFFVLFFYRKRERRMRLYGRVNSFLGRRRPGSPRKMSIRGATSAAGGLVSGILANKLFGGHRSRPSYERVMEDGGAGRFELGDVESPSDDGDPHSDSSECAGSGVVAGSARTNSSLSAAIRYGKLSPGGRTTPLMTDYFSAPVLLTSSSSATDRSGVVIRTESRERLIPLQLLTGGRRSRATSPTRLESPLMMALDEE